MNQVGTCSEGTLMDTKSGHLIEDTPWPMRSRPCSGASCRTGTRAFHTTARSIPSTKETSWWIRWDDTVHELVTLDICMVEKLPDGRFQITP